MTTFSSETGCGTSLSAETGSTATELEKPRTVGILDGTPASGEKHSPTLDTSGTRSTGVDGHQGVPHQGPRTLQPPVAPRIRHRTHALFTSCLENLDRAIDSDTNFFLRNNSLEQLKESLAELWHVRPNREEQFAEVINMLQAVFTGRNVEAFGTNQLTSLRSVLVKLRDEPMYDDDFANAVTSELLKGGIDVFRELD